MRTWGRRTAVAIVVAAAFHVGPVAGQAADPAAGAAKWGPWIDFEGKAGTKRNLGEADAFLPLAQDADTLFFGNAKFRFDDQESLEGNFGLGARHMLDDGWNLGAYGYYDHRRSENDESYHQLTFGAELLGRDVDFRANSYWPVGDKARNLGGSTQSTAALNGAAVQVVTTGVTREERALRGFDVEAGWRLPVFAAEGPLDLRLYAGAFTFDDSEVEDVTGPRLRAEFTAYEVPYLWDGARLTLGVEWQHDDVRGGQAFASLRLRVPLQVFDTAVPSRLSVQERRMTVPVVRDIDIVAQVRTEQRPAMIETATATADGGSLTVFDSGSTTGAALPGAIAAAGANGTVILSGSFNTTATVTLQAGQTLMGAGGLTVRTPSGHTATLTTPTATLAAAIAGGSGSPAIMLADDATVTGLTVNRTSSSSSDSFAIRGSGVSGVTVSNNTVTATADAGGDFAVGIIFDTGSSDNAIIGNTIRTVNTPGSSSDGIVISNAANTTVSDNTIDASGGINRVMSLVNATDVAGTGNVAVSGTCQDSGGNTGSVGFAGGSTCP
ncbi:inverse autotransporter beta domain-containing protein [Pelagibius sp. 7325]|uniref:inverse autotransporter beta domain-containing protein n=1 Tax=Pelagibius sp. 7325 TaxID=3131994 RepID=UPI0030ED51F9